MGQQAVTVTSVPGSITLYYQPLSNSHSPKYLPYVILAIKVQTASSRRHTVYWGGKGYQPPIYSIVQIAYWVSIHANKLMNIGWAGANNTKSIMWLKELVWF